MKPFRGRGGRSNSTSTSKRKVCFAMPLRLLLEQNPKFKLNHYS